MYFTIYCTQSIQTHEVNNADWSGLFVKGEVFTQGTSITVWKMKKRHCNEPQRLLKFCAPRVQFYCTSTAATNAIHTLCMSINTKNMWSKLLPLIQKKNVCLQCHIVKAMWMWVHSIWASALRNWCNSAQGTCSSVFVEAANEIVKALNVSVHPHRGCDPCVGFIWWENKL